MRAPKSQQLRGLGPHWAAAAAAAPPLSPELHAATTATDRHPPPTEIIGRNINSDAFSGAIAGFRPVAHADLRLTDQDRRGLARWPLLPDLPPAALLSR